MELYRDMTNCCSTSITTFIYVYINANDTLTNYLYCDNKSHMLPHKNHFLVNRKILGNKVVVYSRIMVMQL